MMQALIQAWSEYNHQRPHGTLFIQTRGLAFFNVPQQGFDIKGNVPFSVVVAEQAQSGLWIEKQNNDWAPLAHNFSIIIFNSTIR